MTIPSLLLQPCKTNHYTIKEFQLLVKDAPVVPAEIQPFVGVQFRRSGDIYRLFKGLAEMPVETFLVLHLDGKKRMVVGIRCLDHIIIGQDRYFSFADHNLMG